MITAQAEAAFDSSWYSNQYGLKFSSSTEAFQHFMLEGWRLGLDPSPWFSVPGYLMSNPDVAQSGINPLVHYLRSGRQEGRRGFESTKPPPSQWKIDSPDTNNAIVAFSRHTYAVLNPDVASQVPADEWIDHYEHASRAENRYASWKPDDYRFALDLAGLATSGDLLEHFAEVGRHLGLPADGDAWVRRNEDLLNWLELHDATAVRQANWRLREASDGIALWACANQDPHAPVFPSVDAGVCARFFLRLADARLLYRRSDWRSDALWLASYFGAARVALDLAREGQLRWTQSLYDAHLADASHLSPNDAQRLVDGLFETRTRRLLASTSLEATESIRRRPDLTHLRASILERLRDSWQGEVEEARTLVALQRRDEAMRSLCDAAHQTIHGVMRALGSDVGTPSRRTGRVLVVTDTKLPQCLQYRVKSKTELASQRLALDTCTPSEIVNGMQLLAGYEGAIFYRCSHAFEVLEAIAIASQLCRWTALELDDPILGTEYPGTLQQYEGALSGAMGSRMVMDAIGSAALARNCDFGIGSTDAISELLATFVRTERAHTVRNVLPLAAAKELRSREVRQVNSTHAVLATASSSSIRDVLIPSSGIVSWLSNDVARNLTLAIPGDVQLGLPIELRARARLRPANLDYPDYLRELARGGFGLVPLVDTELNRAKSSVRWLDYTAAGLPTIASPIGSYRELAEAGLVLPAGDECWLQVLEELDCHDGTVSQSLVQLWEASRDVALRDYSPMSLVEILEDLTARFWCDS